MAPAESERKVDLASLVLHYKKVKRFLAPLRYVYQRLDDLLRWKSWLNSLLALIILDSISMDAFVLALMLLVLFLLLITRWLNLPKDIVVDEQLGLDVPKPEIQDHDFVLVDMQVNSEKEAKAVMKEYKEIISEIDSLLNEICIAQEYFISVVKWNQPKITMTITIIVLVAILVYPIVPVSGYWIGIVTTAFLFKPYVAYVTDSPSSKISELEHVNGDEKDDDLNSDEVNTKSEILTDSDEEEDSEVNDEDELSRVAKGGSRSISNRKSVMTKFNELKRRRRHIKSGHCRSCESSFGKMLIRRQYCRSCGDSFCSRCCSMKVPRAVFGATAPAAYIETVLVCNACYSDLKDVVEQIQTAATRQNIAHASVLSRNSNIDAS